LFNAYGKGKTVVGLYKKIVLIAFSFLINLSLHTSETINDRDDSILNLEDHGAALMLLSLRQVHSPDMSCSEPKRIKHSFRHCPFCRNTYKKRKTFENHIKAKHAQSPLFQCFLCNKGFTGNVYLAKHIKACQNNIQRIRIT